MKNRWKKLLALCIAFSMAVTAMPAGVAAADYETATEETLAEANVSEEEIAEEEAVEEDDLAEETAEADAAVTGTEEEQAEDSGEIQTEYLGSVENTIDVDTSGLPDNEELFEEYAEAVFTAAEEEEEDAVYTDLTDAENTILQELKSAAAEIACGSRTDTEIVIDDSLLNLNWSYAELGLDTSADDDAIGAAVKAKIADKINLNEISRRLLYDTPYEMYWYAKTIAGSLGEGYGMYLSYSSDDPEDWYIYVCNLTFSFMVDTAYRGSDEYTTDANKTQAANKAAAYAKDIVEAAADKADYLKLGAYRGAICDLVSYNTPAASADYDETVNGIDPWQLIYVFDRDTSTNVVCEGYAKAFQYLCSLTSFNSSKVKCISVSGTMSGGTGAGAHMWNTVRMEDGKNYLVDVTNCDAGTIGEEDKLFLAGTDGSVDEGYKFTIDDLNSVLYTYDEDTLGNYPASRLSLADASYTPSEDETETETHTHTWNAGVVTKEASCTEKGVRTYTCTDTSCGATYTEEIPAKGHTEVIDEAVEATCTKTGLTEGSHCSVCNAVIKAQETIPVAGHTVVTDEAVAATCTEAGKTEGSHCSVCDAIIEEPEIVNATGHTAGAAVAENRVDATCTEDGSYDSVTYCTICNKQLYKETKTIKASGHTVVTDAAVAATCKEAGKTQGSHCSVCGTVLTTQTEIPVLAHTVVTDAAVAPTCTATGLTQGSHCSVCNEIIEAQETIPAAGHKEVTDAAVAETCTETGKTEGSHCSVCNEVIKAQETIPAAGHKEVIDAAVEPTCTETGKTEGSHCSVCNAVIKKQEIIPAGHTNIVTDEAVAATCIEDGKTIGCHCEDCHTVIVPQETIAHPATYKLSYTSATYNRTVYCPTVTVYDTNGAIIDASNYTVAYSNNTNVGSQAKAVVTFKGNYSGEQTLTFTIKAKSIAASTVKTTLSASAYTYKGKVLKPTVKSIDGKTTLTLGKEYKVTYASGLKNVGKYKVTITGIGNYTGTKILYYNINPAGTSLVSVTPGSKKLTVKWKKQAVQTSGYQIQYSLSSSFASGNKTLTISKNTLIQKVIGSLKKGKKYYVRIRTFKTVSGVKYYSAWSEKKYAVVK